MVNYWNAKTKNFKFTAKFPKVITAGKIGDFTSETINTLIKEGYESVWKEYPHFVSAPIAAYSTSSNNE